MEIFIFISEKIFRYLNKLTKCLAKNSDQQHTWYILEFSKFESDLVNPPQS